MLLTQFSASLQSGVMTAPPSGACGEGTGQPGGPQCAVTSFTSGQQRKAGLGEELSLPSDSLVWVTKSAYETTLHEGRN